MVFFDNTHIIIIIWFEVYSCLIYFFIFYRFHHIHIVHTKLIELRILCWCTNFDIHETYKIWNSTNIKRTDSTYKWHPVMENSRKCVTTKFDHQRKNTTLNITEHHTLMHYVISIFRFLHLFIFFSYFASISLMVALFAMLTNQHLKIPIGKLDKFWGFETLHFSYTLNTEHFDTL